MVQDLRRVNFAVQLGSKVGPVTRKLCCCAWPWCRTGDVQTLLLCLAAPLDLRCINFAVVLGSRRKRQVGQCGSTCVDITRSWRSEDSLEEGLASVEVHVSPARGCLKPLQNGQEVRGSWTSEDSSEEAGWTVLKNRVSVSPACGRLKTVSFLLPECTWTQQFGVQGTCN